MGAFLSELQGVRGMSVTLEEKINRLRETVNRLKGYAQKEDGLPF